jgi:hypothetical protein
MLNNVRWHWFHPFVALASTKRQIAIVLRGESAVAVRAE